MLADYQTVKEEAKEFINFEASAGDQGPEFTIQCLKTANWPAYRDLVLVIPPQLDEKFQKFSRFYCNKHAKR